MKTLSRQQEEARNVITISCRMLNRIRKTPPRFSEVQGCFADDCYVLLDDAARMFCAATRERIGEQAALNWSTKLSRLLFNHPEECESILAAVEGAKARENLAHPARAY